MIGSAKNFNICLLRNTFMFGTSIRKTAVDFPGVEIAAPALGFTPLGFQEKPRIHARSASERVLRTEIPHL